MGIGWQCRWVLFNIFLTSVSAINGGPDSEPINPHDKEVQDSLDFAVDSFNTFSKDDHLFIVTQVVSARLQDLGGLLYILDVELERSQCRKGAEENLASCFNVKIVECSQKLLCHFEVLNTFWKHERSLLKNDCKPVG
ncbi:cystatin-like [Mustelus asterias]